MSWKALPFSIFLGILTVIPFLIGLSNTLAQDPNRLTNALHPQGDGMSLSTDALRWGADFTSGIQVESQVAPKQPADLLEQVPLPDVLWRLLVGFALIGIAVLIRNRRLLTGLLLLWTLLPLLIFTPTWTIIYPHYFIASIPAFCLLIGIGAAFLIERVFTHRVLRYGVLAVLGILFVSQGLWWRGMLNYVDTTSTPDGFGTPLHNLLDVRDKLADSRNVIVISDGFQVMYDQEAAVWPVILHGSASCVQTLSGQGMAVLPSGEFAALTGPNAPENALGNRYRQHDEIIFPLRPGEGQYALSFFPETPEWSDLPLVSIPAAHFGSGAQLIGYRLDSNMLYLEWMLPGPVEGDYHYFGHFLDSTGEKRGQVDGLMLPGRSWCKDDRLATWTAIELPPDTVTLRVGLYTLQGGRYVNDSLLDENENPVSSWIDIQLPTR